MMKKDIISKDILKNLLRSIDNHILHLGINDISFINTETYRIEHRRADIVAKINNSFIIHLEIQNNNDKDMPKRMLRYYSDISFISNLPIKQYVIYIGKDKLKMNNSIQDGKLNYSFDIIDISTLDCEKMIQEDTPDSLVLAILCDFKDKNEKDVVKYIIGRLKYHLKDNEDKFNNYLLMLEEFSINRDLQEIVKEGEMLSQIEDWTKLPSYQIGLEKGLEDGFLKGMDRGIERGIEKGIEKGLEQGIEKGIEKGQQEGMAKAILFFSKEFGFSIDEIAQKLGVSTDVIRAYTNKSNG